MLRPVWLIAKTVLVEAIRRKEIYVIVLVSTLLIAAVMTLDFFGLEGLSKFYREIALRVMSTATAITAIVLAARQLPREFEKRTIYPLLAKPVSRFEYLLGKVFGVFLAATFCLLLFMTIYALGSLYVGLSFSGKEIVMLAQYTYLQLIMMMILATLSFWLSMLVNFDAAISIAVLFFALAAVFINVSDMLYQHMDAVGKGVFVFLTFALPQLPLFDFSGKAVHAEFWEPLGAGTIAALTVYGSVYIVLYFAATLICFRRRPL